MFQPDKYGVIVKFAENKFSLKTANQCYWCSSIYFTSAEDIKNKFKLIFHEEILDAPINNKDWIDFHAKIKSILLQLQINQNAK